MWEAVRPPMIRLSIPRLGRRALKIEGSKVGGRAGRLAETEGFEPSIRLYKRITV